MPKMKDAVIAGSLTATALTGSACADLRDTVGDIRGECPAAPEGVRHGNVETFLASNPGFITPEQLKAIDAVFKDGNNDSQQHITGGRGLLKLLEEETARIEEKMPVDGAALKAHQDAAALVRVVDAMARMPDNVFVIVDAPCADRAQLHFASASGPVREPIEFSTNSFTYNGMKQLLDTVRELNTDETLHRTPVATFAGIAVHWVNRLEEQQVKRGADDPGTLSAVERYAVSRRPQAYVSSALGPVTEQMTAGPAGQRTR